MYHKDLRGLAQHLSSAQQSKAEQIGVHVLVVAGDRVHRLRKERGEGGTGAFVPEQKTLGTIDLYRGGTQPIVGVVVETFWGQQGQSTVVVAVVAVAVVAAVEQGG